MKHIVYFRTLLLVTILGCASQVFAQREFFIYLQTETQQPFYIVYGGNNYSSSAAGHLILPKLVNGTYEVQIGFAGTREKTPFRIVVSGKDEGYLISNSTSNGWGLKSLVGSNDVAVFKPAPEVPVVVEPKPVAVVIPEVEKPVEATKTVQTIAVTDPVTVSDVLKNTDNLPKTGTEIVIIPAEKPVIKKEVSNTTKDNKPAANSKYYSDSTAKALDAKLKALEAEEKRLRDERSGKTKVKPATTNATIIEEPKNNVIEGNPKVYKAPANVEVAPAVVATKIVENPTVDIVKDTNKTVTGNTAEILVAPIKTATAKELDIEKTTNTATPSRKFLDIELTADTAGMVQNKPTAKVVEPALEIKTVIDTFPKMDNVQEHVAPIIPKVVMDTAQVIAVLPVDSIMKPAPTTTNTTVEANVLRKPCGAIANEQELQHLVITLKSITDEDDLVYTARKSFKERCYTTYQLRTICNNVTSDAVKYRLLDAAYLYTADYYNYKQLRDLLKEDYYLVRFDTMLK